MALNYYEHAALIASMVAELLRQPDWRTRDEVAERLRCSTSKVSRMVSAMEAAGYGGIYRRGKNLLRIDQNKLFQFM